MGMGISMDFTNWGQKPSVVEDIACANPHTKWRVFGCETHWTKLWIVQLATFDQRMVAMRWGDDPILLTLKLVRNNKSAYLLISGFLWCLTIKMWGLLGKSLRHHGENMGKNMGIRWGIGGYPKDRQRPPKTQRYGNFSGELMINHQIGWTRFTH
jgi:hypothetical protein